MIQRKLLEKKNAPNRSMKKASNLVMMENMGISWQTKRIQMSLINSNVMDISPKRYTRSFWMIKYEMIIPHWEKDLRLHELIQTGPVFMFILDYLSSHVNILIGGPLSFTWNKICRKNRVFSLHGNLLWSTQRWPHTKSECQNLPGYPNMTL